MIVSVWAHKPISNPLFLSVIEQAAPPCCSMLSIPSLKAQWLKLHPGTTAFTVDDSTTLFS